MENGIFERKLIGRLELRDILVVVLLLLLFGVQMLAAKALAGNEVASVGVIIAYMVLCIVFASYMYRGKFKADWKIFCGRLWLNIPLAVGGGLLMLKVLLPLTRMLLGFDTGGEDLASVALSASAAGEAEGEGFVLNRDEMMSMMLMGLLTSLTSSLAPFIEEIVFRHVLFAKWCRGVALTLIMLLVSSFLFGVIHLGNFQGDFIQTVPYMVMGAIFALINLISKNIWCNIGAHFTFNFVNGTGMILFGLIQYASMT